jgi:predicted MPP superfamily phosphohydrolase
MLGYRPTGPLHHVLRLGSVLTRTVGLWPMAVATAMKLTVSELELLCPRLPKALDGFTIVHLSDLHLEVIPDLVDPIVAQLGRIQADLAVITGDFQTDHDKTDPVRATALVKPLVDAIKARHGVYGVLGNHDSWTIVEPLEALGLRMLINAHTDICVGDDAIQLIGIDDVHAFYTDDVVSTLQDAPAGFRVLLSHTPEVADVAAASGYDLYLAGHTHGGQICLPNGRPLLTGLDSNRELASGHWQVGGMHGYTNRGLGTASLPLRFNCTSEIAVLRLRASPG